MSIHHHHPFLESMLDQVERMEPRQCHVNCPLKGRCLMDNDDDGYPAWDTIYIRIPDFAAPFRWIAAHPPRVIWRIRRLIWWLTVQ
jgi:hypothetical protein